MTRESLQETKIFFIKEPHCSEVVFRAPAEKQETPLSASAGKKEKCECAPIRTRTSYAYAEKEQMSIITPFIQIGKAGALIASAVTFPVLTLVALGGALGIPIPWWGDAFHGPLVFTGFLGSALTMIAFEMD